jgi:hypothetical protein
MPSRVAVRPDAAGFRPTVTAAPTNVDAAAEGRRRTSRLAIAGLPAVAC